jgi:hypothetical protein
VPEGKIFDKNVTHLVRSLKKNTSSTGNGETETEFGRKFVTIPNGMFLLHAKKWEFIFPVCFLHKRCDTFLAGKEVSMSICVDQHVRLPLVPRVHLPHPVTRPQARPPRVEHTFLQIRRKLGNTYSSIFLAINLAFKSYRKNAEIFSHLVSTLLVLFIVRALLN